MNVVSGHFMGRTIVGWDKTSNPYIRCNFTNTEEHKGLGLYVCVFSQVLEVVRSNYDTLTLKLQDNLDHFDKYAEKLSEAAFFTQLVRTATPLLPPTLLFSPLLSPPPLSAAVSDYLSERHYRTVQCPTVDSSQ